MPTYIYRNPDNTDEIVEICQGMNDTHEYFDKNGAKWTRVFQSPQMAIDTNIDPFSKKDFLKKTSSKGSIGDLLDRSQEMSDRRAEKIGGDDPVRKKAEKQFYEPKRKK